MFIPYSRTASMTESPSSPVLERVSDGATPYDLRGRGHVSHSGKHCEGSTPMQTYRESLPIAREKLVWFDHTDKAA